MISVPRENLVSFTFVEPGPGDPHLASPTFYTDPGTLTGKEHIALDPGADG